MPSNSNPDAQLRFKISGMDCAEEVAILKREVGPSVGGEENLAFDVLNGKMSVTGQTDPKIIIDSVARTGMHASLWQEASDSREEGSFQKQNGRMLFTVASGLLAVLAILVHTFQAQSLSIALGLSGEASTPLSSIVLYVLSVLAGVWYFLPKAWYSLKTLRPDMNLLMIVAVSGAMLIGEWSEAATVAFLFSVSLLLESWSVGRARRAVAALMNLAPPVARIRKSQGEIVEMPPEAVPVKAIFIVRPGERIPLDGRVQKGESQVNQASITGESMPVPKAIGDEVFAGTINGDSLLEVESTKAATDTTLARIIRMVGDAQAKRGPSEQWVEKFARVYTPSVMFLAIAVFIVPTLLFGGEWHAWLYNALVLLVIACPCALVISTPVSIVAAIASAASRGVLIKGGLYVEIPAKLKAIALDKTGTLTAGKPAVIEVVPLSGHDEKELLERAAAMEAQSDHPLAQAIVAYAHSKNVTPSSAENFAIVQGKGAEATIGGRKFWLGSHRYLEERNQETPEVHEQLERMSSEGRSVVVIGNEKHVCGFITLADPIRPETKEALSSLRKEGIEHLIMLTGDNRPTAEAIAQRTGVDEFRAELLPEDKVRAIEALVEKYGNVGMIGDGVNDAPALGRATLGIAMGAVGSDAAIETADVALMSDDLSRVAWLIAHSRRTLSIIRQNIFASLAVKALFMLLTLGGIASLWLAIAADMGVSFLVIANSLRLLKSREDAMG